MTFDEPRILRLPKTGTLTRVMTLNSGNTFRASYWTDGRMIAPMLPDEPDLMVHRPTNELFWREDCKVARSSRKNPKRLDDDSIGLLGGDEDRESSDSIPFADDPEPPDLERALSSGLADTPTRHQYLRLQLWWAHNDAFRDPNIPLNHPIGFEANLRALLRLLNMRRGVDRLLAAEAHRELGDFGEAVTLLSRRINQDLVQRAAIIRDLALNQDTRVRQF